MAEKKTPLPAQPSLVGDKVYLRPVTAEDIVNMHYWSVQSEPQSMSSHPRIIRTASEEAQLFKEAKRSPDKQGFAVVRKKDKMPVGMVRFFDLNQLNRSAELGLLIDPDEHRKGYGSGALKVLCRYLFKYRGLNKVYAQTAGFNTATAALLESLRFKKDATLRDHYFYNGEFHVGFIYSLLLYELEW
ncbi:MAG: GNAT family N-acetyltransferase [candidate division Zixibacteria bacterium]|nr:GNAT family N-acetyltransferase [candidate division Zixibacteria bacterium]